MSFQYIQRGASSWSATGTAIAAALIAASLSADALALEASGFPPLDKAAVMSVKALHGVMLAVAPAGQRLVAVGAAGVVLLSDDNGKTWQQAKVPVRVTLTAVQFVSDKEGWAVGHFGVVLHTSDGGGSWQRQLDGVEAAALVMKSAKDKLAAAAQATPELEKSVAAAKRLVEEGPDKPLLGLYFKNKDTGFVIGAYNMMFRTDDGGRSWQAWGGRTDNQRALHLYGIRPAGNALVLVGEQGLLRYSSDDGASFKALASPYKGSYFGLVTTGSGEIVVFGLRGNAYWSGDQGNAWKKIDTGTEGSLSSGFELKESAIMLTSQRGDVLLSEDKGQTFRKLEQGAQVPIAGSALARDGALVVTGLRGVARLAGPGARPADHASR
jgi:photosystem II stability/assembly factor-like uncharacterized protein